MGNWFASWAWEAGQGILRHALTGAGGWLIAHGILQSSQMNDWIGSTLFFAGLAWSAYEKYSRTKG